MEGDGTRNLVRDRVRVRVRIGWKATVHATWLGIG